MENSKYTNAKFEYIAYDTVNREYCTVENFNNLKKSIYPHMLRISLDYDSNMYYPLHLKNELLTNYFQIKKNL